MNPKNPSSQIEFYQLNNDIMDSLVQKRIM